MNSRLLQRLGTALAALAIGALCSNAEPFVPRDGNQVLERLRSNPFDPEARKLRELRGRLTREPDNLEVALELARLCIQRSRAEADPRYLGHAEAALSRWWNSPKAPAQVLVLRATLEQSLHDFPGALSDLDTVLKFAPDNAQAWLTRATILAVLGRYAEARRACVPLLHLAPGLVAMTAISNIASLTGQADQAAALLRGALDANRATEISERLWALTLLAETCGRAGRVTEAEQAFQQALALGRRDAYLLGAYADFLLDQGRPAEVATLLKDETRADGLLLRLALAESLTTPRPAAFTAHLALLRQRFEASRLRGDSVHRREEARFTLDLLHAPAEALRLAQANWGVQHEPADVRILLESALAAHDGEAARPALKFLEETHLEDPRLAALAHQLANHN